MAELSDDVMDFARRRLGAGIGVNIAPVADVASALRNVIDELQLAHPERVIEERMGAIGMVHCDRARLKPLKQLMSNLLGMPSRMGRPSSRCGRRHRRTRTSSRYRYATAAT